MADKVYVVTLKQKDDLEGFYSDMESDGYTIQMKRPISRNTHYFMTDEQAVEIRKDSRVLAVELRPEDIPYLELGHNAANVGIINNEPYGHGTQFRKTGTFGPDDRDWGKLHVAGTDVQRRKGSWGGGTVNDNAEVFNWGKHVDVVICDDPVSFDCEEWKALSDNRDRFQMYDWYAELNSWVTSIDDDGTAVAGSNYSNYFTNATNTTYHGTHVCGTVAGKWYGWAPEANIYSMQVLGNTSNQGTAVPTLLIFDYLRAFHRYKPVNLETGYRNPTITNHSWGWSSNLTSLFDGGINISQVGSIVYRGTTYSSNNPNPSGWSMAGIEQDFGIGAFKRKFNYHYAAINADVEDAIEDGVVIIGAAGNNDFYSPSSEPTDPSYVDWNNTVYLNNNSGWAGTLYFQRGSSPCNAKGVINVGALDHESDFRRASFSNFGPRVDVWAPGVEIVSCFNNLGTPDNKYGGSNYFEAIQGTSMASPQVCGVAAILATGKTRFTNSDVKAYIQQHGKYNDMTWDIQGGDFADSTCRGLNNGLYFDGDAPELTCKITRDTGHMGGWYKDQLKGHRRHKEVLKRGQVQLYPRVNQYYRPIPWDIMKIVLYVTTSGGNYEFTGVDRTTSHSNSYGATINLNVGDTVNFVLQNVGTTHPFYIKNNPVTGNADLVSNPSAIGQGSVGNNTVSWTPSVAGTYYYQCFNHTSMNGQIIVT